MTKYREILRLKSLGFSERNIAHSCGNIVVKLVKKAAEINLSWPLDHEPTAHLRKYFSPRQNQQPIEGCQFTVYVFSEIYKMT